MSEFIIEFTSHESKLGQSFYATPKDERWKNFPPCFLPFPYLEVLPKVKSCKVYQDDVFVTGFPRSGTTLVSEMLWLIVNNFDFEKAAKLVTDDRVVGLEYDDMTQTIQKGKVMNTLETMSRPRTIRTHLPVQLLPDDVWIQQPKIIYCSREPKDNATSFYHFGKHYDVNMKMGEAFNSILTDHYFYCPYREHRLNYWNLPSYLNILYLTFDFVVENMDEAIRKVAAFVNVAVSDANVLLLKDYLSFDRMKKNTATNNKLYLEKLNELTKQNSDTTNFIRRGKIGAYKDEMPAEFIEKFDSWIAKEKEITTGFPQ